MPVLKAKGKPGPPARDHEKSRHSFRYTGPNENFVLVSRESGGSLQADSAEKLVEIIGDALVEPVQCASFLFG